MKTPKQKLQQEHYIIQRAFACIYAQLKILGRHDALDWREVDQLESRIYGQQLMYIGEISTQLNLSAKVKGLVDET